MPNETWEVAEAKVKQAIQEQLGIDVDIERAHQLKGEITIAAAKTPNKGSPLRLCVSFAPGNKEKQSLRKLGKASQVVF